MHRALLLLLAVTALAQAPSPQRILRVERSSPGDLEVGRELKGLPAGATGYLRYEDAGGRR
jgi:hypothetical protein